MEVEELVRRAALAAVKEAQAARPPLPKKLFTADEAAHWLGLSPRTLEELRLEGRPPAARRFGRKVLYDIDDLRKFAESLPRTDVE